MTKSELTKKMTDFINRQATHKDEWYFSDRSMATYVLTNFAKDELGIEILDLEEEQ